MESRFCCKINENKPELTFIKTDRNDFHGSEDMDEKNDHIKETISNNDEPAQRNRTEKWKSSKRIYS